MQRRCTPYLGWLLALFELLYIITIRMHPDLSQRGITSPYDS